MVRLYFILCFFAASQMASFAQITVSDASYIYVDSVYVFADLPIHLKTADSHIYLRNQGQLLQGDIAGFDNTGLGSLSVYQTGNVHEYAFNFWCSPVGSNTIDSSINNVFSPTLLGDPDSSASTINYVPATFTTNLEGSSSPLVISERWIYTLDATNTDFNFIGEAGDINAGLGFTMKGTAGSNKSQKYEFRGKPNAGTISNTVLPNQSIFIGNPYPSGFDALKFIHDADNVNAISGTLLFWEQNLEVLSHNRADYEGGYATYTVSSDGLVETFVPAPFNTYNNDGSINTNGDGEGTKIATRYLSIGQGFLVTGKVGTSGTVKTKNSHRAYSNTLQTPDALFKTSLNKDKIASEHMQLRLNIDFDDLYTRQLVHNFNDNATEGFDYGMEIKKLSELENDAFWIQKDELYVAKASVFKNDLSIPIVIKLKANATLGFRLFDLKNFDNQQNVYLFDKETGSSYNLISQVVTLNIDLGTYADRFEIRFQNETLSVAGENINQLYLSAYFDSAASEINISNKNTIAVNTVFLYNVNGMKVLSTKVNTSDTAIKIAASHLSAGIYFLKCLTDAKIEDFKIVVR